MIALLARVSEHQSLSWPDAAVLVAMLAFLALALWLVAKR